MVRALRIAGKAWLWLSWAAIILGLGTIAWQDGLGAMFEIMDPRNVLNLIAIAITFAPGILLLTWADHIERKRLSR